jgi:hypothetical protein
MIDYLVEQALIDLITPHLPAGTVVRHAMESPAAADQTLEGLVVKAVVENNTEGRRPHYNVRATFEFKTLAPEDETADVQAVMGALEAALFSVPATVPDSVLRFSEFAIRQNAWDHTDHRLAGERRENSREILLTCSPAS